MRAYDSSEQANAKELDEEEIQSILDSKRSFLKDHDKILHFVNRALATVKIHARQTQSLHDQISMLEVKRQNQTDPVNQALDALKMLPADKRDKVLGLHIQQRLAEVDKTNSDALRAISGARNESKKVRFMLSKLLEDPNLNDASKEKIKQVIDKIPNKQEPVLEENLIKVNVPKEFMPPTKDELGSLFD